MAASVDQDIVGRTPLPSIIESDETAGAHGEIGALRTELAMVKAELEAAKAEAKASKARIASLEQQMKEAVPVAANEGFSAEYYADHADLKSLAEGISSLAWKSKQSRTDLDDLVQALSLLQ